MGYTIATVLVSAIPTGAAVVFVLTRPQLNRHDKTTVFGIWAVIVVPVGFAIFIVSLIVYMSTVGYGGWNANPRQLDFVLAVPLSMILN